MPPSASGETLTEAEGREGDASPGGKRVWEGFEHGEFRHGDEKVGEGDEW